MAHKEQRDFILKLKLIYPSFFNNKNVLEVGSLNINGSIRDFFNNCKYVGIDVGEGPDVDVICHGQDYDAPDNFFDVVCSVECFEHNPYWIETFLNMIRMCKNDGLVFFTCASTGRAEHGTLKTSPESSPHTANWNYYKNLEEKDFTSKLIFDDIFTEYSFEYNPHSYDLYFYGIKKQNKPNKKVIDCFPFFNERELLELRLNLLSDHVDEFIISELNYTHSGKPKDFICKSIVDELGFSNKVTVLQVEIDDDLIPNEIDNYNSLESKSSKEVLAWTRERVQRDALLEIIEKYDDDTVFIIGDCDEIIDPKFINYFSDICKNNQNNILKIPLILLEGRADKRLFMGNNAVLWMNSLLMCTSKQLKDGGTPTKMRSNISNNYPPVWATESNQIIQDCGWHFTWMGDINRKIEKASSFIHYSNLDSINTLSSESIEQVFSRIPNKNPLQEMNNEEKNNYERRNYPVELLPKIIFNLPRVKNFLLPKEENLGIKNKLLDLYKKFDSQFGVWGWCPIEKSNKIIDCVSEICKNEDNPVCVEIGVYGGKSLISFALALKKLNKGIVYGIDPWTNSDAIVGYDGPHKEFWGNVDLERIYNICISAIQELDINGFVNLIRDTSDNTKEIKNINVLHIDGQHTDQLIKDINKYAKNVILNGYCFIDDVEWSDQTLKSVSLMERLGFEKVCDIFGCILFQRKTVIDKVTFHISSNQKHTCWIVDNFYEDPDAVREFALEQDYLEGGIGRGFIGRRTHSQFLFPGLKEKFEEIIGKKITKWEEHGMNGRFQIAWSGEPLVYHCDSQKWGGMLYLTPNAPYQCGTTLYAHKQTRARTYHDDGWDAAWNHPGGSHLDGTPFEPVDVMGNVYNRLVIFDASCIHSASQYFGTVKENSRLWQMFFFDTDD